MRKQEKSSQGQGPGRDSPQAPAPSTNGTLLLHGPTRPEAAPSTGMMDGAWDAPRRTSHREEVSRDTGPRDGRFRLGLARCNSQPAGATELGGRRTPFLPAIRTLALQETAGMQDSEVRPQEQRRSDRELHQKQVFPSLCPTVRGAFIKSACDLERSAPSQTDAALSQQPPGPPLPRAAVRLLSEGEALS